MKIATTLSFLFAATGLVAQPTITAGDAPAIGEQFTYASGTYVVLPNGGANQTWDFSGSAGSSGEALTVIAASNGEGAADFPGASVALVNSSLEEYIGISAAGFEHLGQYIAGDGIVYTDPELYLPIPCVYGQSWNDDFAAIWGGGANSFTGNLSAVASGYGTLILPGTTLTNVLRIDQTLTRDENSGFTYVRTSNFFYRPGTGYLVANNERLDLYFGTNLLATSEEVTYLAAAGIGMAENNTDAIGLDLVPNPATDAVGLVFGAGGTMQVSVFDAQGRSVITAAMGKLVPGIHRQELSVADLSTGIYTVRVSNTNGEQGTRRLVKN